MRSHLEMGMIAVRACDFRAEVSVQTSIANLPHVATKCFWPHKDWQSNLHPLARPTPHSLFVFAFVRLKVCYLPNKVAACYCTAVLTNRRLAKHDGSSIEVDAAFGQGFEACLVAGARASNYLQACPRTGWLCPHRVDNTFQVVSEVIFNPRSCFCLAFCCSRANSEQNLAMSL